MGSFFDTSGFVPRAQCGSGWTADKIWWDNSANLLVFWAYVFIPLVLLVIFVQVRKSLPRPERGGLGTAERQRLVEAHPLHGFPVWVIAAAGLFILSCGVGHLWDVVVFHRPMYNLFIAWNLLTGVASWVALVGIIQAARWLKHKFLALWTTVGSTVARLEISLENETAARQEKHRLANELHAQNLQLQVLVQSLRDDLAAVTSEKERKGLSDAWANAKHETLDKLLANVLEITGDASRGRPDSGP